MRQSAEPGVKSRRPLFYALVSLSVQRFPDAFFLSKCVIFCVISSAGRVEDIACDFLEELPLSKAQLSYICKCG